MNPVRKLAKSPIFQNWQRAIKSLFGSEEYVSNFLTG